MTRSTLAGMPVITVLSGENQRWETHVTGKYENAYERGCQERLWIGAGLVTKCLPHEAAKMASSITGLLLDWHADEGSVDNNGIGENCPLNLVIYPNTTAGVKRTDRRGQREGQDYVEFILQPNATGLEITVDDLSRVRDKIRQRLQKQ